jgi:ABC-type tungstate transport system substrate-binding protein
MNSTAVTIVALIGIVAVIVLAVQFVRFCLDDLGNATEVRMFTPQVWALLIIITIPIGGMLYLIYGRSGPGGGRAVH